MRLKRRIERYIRGWFPQEPKRSMQWPKYGLGVALFALLSLSFVYVLLNSSSLAYVGASSILWSRTIGGANSEQPRSFIKTSDGGYLITGHTSAHFEGVAKEWWLIRTDESGNTLWTKTYSGIEVPVEAPRALIEIASGGYAFAGTIDSPTFYDFWLAETDAVGNIVWSQTYDSGGVDEISTMIQTPDGGYLLAGTTAAIYYRTFPHMDPPPELSDEAKEKFEEVQEARANPRPSAGACTDALLVKTDENGNMECNLIYPGGNEPTFWRISSLVATPDGGYALAGFMRGYGESGFWLAKIDGFGNLEWSQSYGGDEASCLLTTSDGGYIIAGTTTSFGLDRDFYLVKTDENGNMQWNKAYGETYEVDTNSSIETEKDDCSLVETSDGGYLLTGSTRTYDLSLENVEERYTPISWGCWLVKTDSSGNMEWNQTVAEKEIISLAKTREGGYAFVGMAFDTSIDTINYFITRSETPLPSGIGNQYLIWCFKTSDIWLGEIGELNSSLEVVPST